MTSWPYSAILVILLCGGVWLASLGLEWLVASWRRRRRISDAALRTYHREALRESAPQFVTWPTPEERVERSKP